MSEIWNTSCAVFFFYSYSSNSLQPQCVIWKDMLTHDWVWPKETWTWRSVRMETGGVSRGEGRETNQTWTHGQQYMGQTPVKLSFKHLLWHFIEEQFFAKWEKTFHILVPLNLSKDVSLQVTHLERFKRVK